jgi:hypothetical protein
MLGIAFGLAALWWILPMLFPSRTRAAIGVRVLGTIAVIGGAVVTLLPADRFGDVHGIAIVVAGVPGIFAAALAVHALAIERSRVAAATGAATLVLSTVALAIYLRQWFVPGPGPIAGAISERLALLSLLLWMATVARATRALYPRKKPPRP